jgi:hypothetical protein
MKHLSRNLLTIVALLAMTTGAWAQTNAPEVTISDDKTEASFDMPAEDVMLEYDIVRNMASNMTASVGDGTEGYRIRLKNEGEGFVPADLTTEEIMNFVKVYDQTEQKFLTVGTDFQAAIYALDDDGNPTGDVIAFAALTPGRYVAIATAVDESNYAGTTGASNVFELYSETTGIDIVNGKEIKDNSSRAYNLNGQRVEHLKKGIYILNGRKVVIK